MPDFLHEITIVAVPHKVFEAITTQQGLQRWWAPHVSAEPIVGSMVQANFRNGQFIIKMEVTALDAGRYIEWAPREAIAPWNGSRVTWKLSSIAQGTLVSFGHHGVVSASADGTLPGADAWAFYLTGLKAYLETGKGHPDGFITT